MLDRFLNAALQRPLQRMASGLVALGLRADQMTWAGFVMGLTAIPLIALGHADWALLSMGSTVWPMGWTVPWPA
jgi:hypothetical protein